MTADVVQIIGVALQAIGVLWAAAAFTTKIKTRLDRIEAEYKPNHGTSMRDAINRIENKLSKLEGRFEQHVEESE